MPAKSQMRTTRGVSHIRAPRGVTADASPAQMARARRAADKRRILGRGMATKKVTITLDEEQLEAVRRLVEAGTSPSVSGFVQHAIGVALNDVAGWGAILHQALEETGGPLTKKERAWADGILKARSRGRRRGRAA